MGKIEIKNVKLITFGIIMVVIVVLFLGFKPATKQQSENATNMAFEKKKECASYIDEIKEKLLAISGTIDTSSIKHELDEVWYSPKLNSCLYSQKSTIYTSDTNIKPITVYAIYDYLENKTIPLSFTPEMISSSNYKVSEENDYAKFEYTKASLK